MPDELAVSFTADVDEAQQRELATVLGLNDIDDSRYPERVTNVAKAAFEEIVAWATARDRPSVTSEIERRRVLRLFAEIRREPVTVEALVDELAFTEGRARTMVSRMRYSDARMLRGLAYRAAHDDLVARVSAREAKDGMKSVRLPKATYEAVREAEAEILLHDPPDTAKVIDATSRRYDVACTATVAMWQLVIDRLESMATALGVGGDD
jgi:hypothetical protein